MWFDPTRARPDWSAAERHLARASPVLRRVIGEVGPCGLSPLPEPFDALVLSVFSQQLSVKGAETLYGRFVGRMTRKKPTPRKIVAALEPGFADALGRRDDPPMRRQPAEAGLPARPLATTHR